MGDFRSQLWLHFVSEGIEDRERFASFVAHDADRDSQIELHIESPCCQSPSAHCAAIEQICAA